ncbi:MAG: sensor histidine kinase N-terminal domain-containing protein [Pirellulales bacterium]
MTLANRITAFFFGALAILLLGNSLLIYGVARYWLTHRFDKQLQSTLNTLVAAVEVEDDDVKWEPSDHVVTLGDGESDDIRWIVVDEAGQVVARERALRPNSLEDVELTTLARRRREFRASRLAFVFVATTGRAASEVRHRARLPLSTARYGSRSRGDTRRCILR